MCKMRVSRTPPHHPVISQPQTERLRPLDATRAWAPAFPLLLVWKVAFFLVFDRCFLHRRRVDFCQAHDARLLILYGGDVGVL